MTLRKQILPIHDVPEEVNETLGPWYEKLIVSDPAYSHVVDWAIPTYQMMLFDDEQWLSVLEILEHTITVDGNPIHVGGISGVMTHPNYQGNGHASHLMRDAIQFLKDKPDVKFGFLICKASLIHYYERLGWQPVEGNMVFSQPNGTGTFDPTKVFAMIYPLSEAAWAGGEIDFCGPPW